MTKCFQFLSLSGCLILHTPYPFMYAFLLIEMHSFILFLKMVLYSMYGSAIFFINTTVCVLVIFLSPYRLTSFFLTAA